MSAPARENGERAGGRQKSKRRHSLIRSAFKLLRGRPVGLIGGVITLLLLLTGIFADFLAPYGMNEVHVDDSLQPSSAQYWLGTDNLGRDILSRVIYGARVSVIVGLSASMVATIISVLVGTLSGYVGGRFDLLVQRAVDGLMCVPSIILLMVIISVVGAGMWSIILLLGFLPGIVGSRIIRSAVIGIKENMYVTAARSTGCSTRRILVRHMLPNILAPTIILFTVRVPSMIMTEASLSFLGFGIPPPFPSWGGMLSGRGREYMFEAPWMAIWPGLALATVVYGVNMFGDTVRDLLDPRLRGGIGSYGSTARKVLVKSGKKLLAAAQTSGDHERREESDGGLDPSTKSTVGRKRT
jgi:peptide/nickel transport system permease protein